MEKLLLCALVLLCPLDAVEAARTQGPSFQARMTRGLPLSPEGNGQQPQHLDGPACQGTPCPSLTTGSLTTRLDQSRWPTDGSLETKDSDPKGGKGPGGSWSFKENALEYWSVVAIYFLAIIGAVLFILTCCCYLTLCRKPPHPDTSESEWFHLQSTSSSLNSPRDYGAITNADAEGQDNTSAEDDEHNDDKAPLFWTINNDGEPSYRLKRTTVSETAL